MGDGFRESLRGDALPGVNQLIRLTVGSGSDPDAEPVARDAPSRVEDVTVAPGPSRRSPTSRILHVATPRYRGDVEEPRIGTWCQVSWLTPIGIFELDAVYDGRDMVGPAVKAWRLITSGRTRRVQRRRFVRVPWTAPILIRVDGTTFPGQCTDLGEGGVRCLLPLPQLEVDTEVEALFSGEEGQLVLPAKILRSEEVTMGNGKKAQLVLVFADPDQVGDQVRRLVFAEQLRLRRAGLE
jgi:hypothetical protein